VRVSADLEKLLSIVAKNDVYDVSTTDESIVSLVASDYSDEESLLRFRAVGATFLPRLISIAFSPGTNSSAFVAHQAKCSLQRILLLEIDLNSVERHEGLIRYLIETAKISNSEKETMYVLRLIMSFCLQSQNRTVLGRYPGLLNTLIHVALTSPNEEIKENAVGSISVLSSEPLNKSLMTHQQILDGLVLLTHEDRYSTQLLAAQTLNLLSSAAGHDVLFTTYKDGVIIDTLVFLTKDVLKRLVAIAAMNALSHLIRRQTASEILASQPYLLSTLALQAADCSFNDVAATAAKVIKKFSMFVNSPDAEHLELLRNLATVLSSPYQPVLLTGLSAILKQASIPVNRRVMVECKQLIVALHVSSKSESL